MIWFFSPSHHDSHERLLKLLVEHLSADVDAGEPASVTRVAVVPANGVLQPTDLRVDKQGLSSQLLFDRQRLK